MLEIADGGRADIVSRQQMRGVASILAGDQISFGENACRTRREIFEVADWSRDDIEDARAASKWTSSWASSRLR